MFVFMWFLYSLTIESLFHFVLSLSLRLIFYFLQYGFPFYNFSFLQDLMIYMNVHSLHFMKEKQVIIWIMGKEE